jgi:hypothetical protein
MEEKESSNKMMSLFFGVIGILLGVPLSYFFQNPMIRKIPLTEYIKHIPEVLSKSDPMLGDLATPVILTCAICAFLMGVLGYFISKSTDS